MALVRTDKGDPKKKKGLKRIHTGPTMWESTAKGSPLPKLYSKTGGYLMGRPTGQGFRTARKGPSVEGPPQDVVVDEDYQQGKSFKIED